MYSGGRSTPIIYLSKKVPVQQIYHYKSVIQKVYFSKSTEVLSAKFTESIKSKSTRSAVRCD